METEGWSLSRRRDLVWGNDQRDESKNGTFGQETTLVKEILNLVQDEGDEEVVRVGANVVLTSGSPPDTPGVDGDPPWIDEVGIGGWVVRKRTSGGDTVPKGTGRVDFV